MTRISNRKISTVMAAVLKSRSFPTVTFVKSVNAALRKSWKIVRAAICIPAISWKTFSKMYQMQEPPWTGYVRKSIWKMAFLESINKREGCSLKKAYARELIEKYVKGWKDRNLDMLLEVVHEQVEVWECTGAIYQGKKTLEKWFTDWYQGTNRITHWDIDSFGFDNEESAAFIEWKFRCIHENKEYQFEGSSVIYFKDELIFRVNEYETKLEKSYPYN